MTRNLNGICAALIALSFVPPAVAQVPLPWTDDFESGSFDAGSWEFPAGAGNWTVSSYPSGSLAATFYWFPVTTNYSYVLASPWLDGSSAESILWTYDVQFIPFANTGQERLQAVYTLDGSTWTVVNEHVNLVGFGPQTESVDLTALVGGQAFRIGFLAQGVDSFQIDWWVVDNVAVGEAPPAGPGPGPGPEPTPPTGLSLPWQEDFESGNLAAGGWELPWGAGTWGIYATDLIGGLAAAMFAWYPESLNYSFVLASPWLDGSTAETILWTYDVLFDDYGSTGLEKLQAAYTLDGATWTVVNEYVNLGDFGPQAESVDLTAAVAGQPFRIGFVATGENSWNIDWWIVDNVAVGEAPPAGPGPGPGPEPTPPTGLSLPWQEDFESGNLAAGGWELPWGAGTWGVYATDLIGGVGAAAFVWYPESVNYSFVLAGPWLDGSTAETILWTYDVLLDDYGYTGLEKLQAAYTLDGATWTVVDEYVNLGDFGPQAESVDLTAAVGGQPFRVGFIATGEDSWNIDWWIVDNVAVGGGIGGLTASSFGAGVSTPAIASTGAAMVPSRPTGNPLPERPDSTPSPIPAPGEGTDDDEGGGDGESPASGQPVAADETPSLDSGAIDPVVPVAGSPATSAPRDDGSPRDPRSRKKGCHAGFATRSPLPGELRFAPLLALLLLAVRWRRR